MGAVENMEKVEKVLRCGATWPGPVELNQVRYGPIQHQNLHHDLDMHETVVGARVVEEVVASCKTDPETTRKRRKRRTKTTNPKETGEGEKEDTNGTRKQSTGTRKTKDDDDVVKEKRKKKKKKRTKDIPPLLWYKNNTVA